MPDYIVDDCIKLADPKWVKVMLYIFRHQHDFTYEPAQIAAALGIGVKTEDVENALSYLEQVGAVCLVNREQLTVNSDRVAVNGELATAFDVINDNNNTQSITSAIEDEGVSEARQRERVVKSLTPKEIAERINESEELKFLFKSAEDIFARVLNHTEHRSLIWLTDYYGLPADILLMIIAYCESSGKASMSRVEGIARAWHERGINSHEKAQEEIIRMQQSGTLTGKIKSRLEINRVLTSKEKDFAEVWSDKRIDIELIVLAYEKTVAATGKLSFNYMNKILIGWYDNGYKTTEQIEQADREFASSNKKSTAKQRNTVTEHSYDLDKIVEHSVNNIPKYKSKRKGAVESGV